MAPSANVIKRFSLALLIAADAASGVGCGGVDMVEVASDPDRGALAYEASSSDPAVARAMVTGTLLTVEEPSRGIADVTVTARDDRAAEVRQVVEVLAKEWTQLAMTWDGGRLAFYVDPAEQGTRSAGSIHVTDTFAGIGARSEEASKTTNSPRSSPARSTRSCSSAARSTRRRSVTCSRRSSAPSSSPPVDPRVPGPRSAEPDQPRSASASATGASAWNPRGRPRPLPVPPSRRSRGPRPRGPLLTTRGEGTSKLLSCGWSRAETAAAGVFDPPKMGGEALASRTCCGRLTKR